MSEKTLQHLSHSIIFHGNKEFTGNSESVVDFNKIGYIQMKLTSGELFIGAEGVGSDGYPLADSELIMTSASLNKIHASGNGAVSWIGSYSN